MLAIALGTQKESTMMNNRSTAAGGHSEYNDRAVRQQQQQQHAETETSTIGSFEEQMLMDYLLEQGFAWNEAQKLMGIKEHFYENAEIRQRMQEDCRVQFARWLYEQGEISEIGEA
jgi:hypothetical protein